VHDGKEIGLDRMSKESRRSYLEMAAVLADMFPGGRIDQNFRWGPDDRHAGTDWRPIDPR
jgi:hypothetical protein